MKILLTYDNDAYIIKYHSRNWKSSIAFWSEFYDFLLHMLNTCDGKISVFVAILELDENDELKPCSWYVVEAMNTKELLNRYGKETYIKTAIRNINYINAHSSTCENCITSPIFIDYYPFDLEFLNNPEKIRELMFSFKSSQQ